MPPDGAEVIRRRAVVVASLPRGLELQWMESQCRGCVGCGGRCGLFASDEAGTLRLDLERSDLHPGQLVDVEVAAPRLRQAASRAYGLALVAILAGAGIGHAMGALAGEANLGALIGLLLGTFSAGHLTKRLDASPPLRVRPCHESRHDPLELPR